MFRPLFHQTFRNVEVSWLEAVVVSAQLITALPPQSGTALNPSLCLVLKNGGAAKYYSTRLSSVGGAGTAQTSMADPMLTGSFSG